MPRGRVSKPLKDAGGIEEAGHCFRAHVQYSEADKNNHIYGPHRNDRSQAQKDLDDMRACGALFGEDRANGLVAMKAEARRIQERVTHEREIRQAALLRGPSGFDSDDSDLGDDPEGYVHDPNEWWQDLQDGKIPKPVIPPKKEITNATEATEALVKFRPLHEDTAELRRLLELRADPNATLPNSKLRVVDNVLTFAHPDRIAAMRELLLEHGAAETEEDKRYWRLRQVNDAYEYRRVQAFYEDDRHLSPIGAAMGL